MIKREFGKSPFSNGAKYCNHCGNGLQVGIYIKWEGLFCPCCGFKLRVGSRHRKQTPKHTCVKCQSTISMRGEFSLWFQDNLSNDVCWKCWFKIHMAICIDCGKRAKLIIGDKKFVIIATNKIRCLSCHNSFNYKKLKQNLKKKMENAIIPRFL